MSTCLRSSSAFRFWLVVLWHAQRATFAIALLPSPMGFHSASSFVSFDSYFSGLPFVGWPVPRDSRLRLSCGCGVRIACVPRLAGSMLGVAACGDMWPTGGALPADLWSANTGCTKIGLLAWFLSDFGIFSWIIQLNLDKVTSSFAIFSIREKNCEEFIKEQYISFAKKVLNDSQTDNTKKTLWNASRWCSNFKESLPHLTKNLLDDPLTDFKEKP